MPEKNLKNLFTAVPDGLCGEFSEVLAGGPAGSLRIERIVSHGQASPPGFWYDQAETEWVALLGGSAVLRFEDEAETVGLRPGDWVEIAPHRRHRVEDTSRDGATVWLAIFWG